LLKNTDPVLRTTDPVLRYGDNIKIQYMNNYHQHGAHFIHVADHKELMAHPAPAGHFTLHKV